MSEVTVALAAFAGSVAGTGVTVVAAAYVAKRKLGNSMLGGLV